MEHQFNHQVYSLHHRPSTVTSSGPPPRKLYNVGRILHQQINSWTLSSLFDPTYRPKEKLDSRLGEEDEEGALKSTIVKLEKMGRDCEKKTFL